MATGLSNLLIAAPVVLSCGMISSTSIHAKVETDGTVGRRLQLDGPEFAIRADLGRQAGRNLFHSFDRFSLATGERATFSGPDQIRNVISRVTGGARSDIDGTIASTIAGANFYFLNPAGVVFGPNAGLDLQGSFHVSTADELRFTDGARFSATNPTASSLSVAAPEAFGFLGSSPAPILIDQSVLEVPTGKSFSIVGGDLDITGGPEGFIGAEAGRITLAAVGGPGEARLGSGAIDAVRKADISLTVQALVETGGNGGGTIYIRGSNFVVEGHSFVSARNSGPLDALGGIDVDAHRVRVTGDSALTTDTLGPGQGGNLRVNAPAVRLSDGGLLSAAVRERGNAGNVEIEAGELEILEGSGIRGSTYSEGNAGRVTVEADHLLIRRGASEFFTGIASDANPGSSGDAGIVQIAAGELEIREGGNISSDTLSFGDAGRVTIEADRVKIVAGGSIASATFSEGDAGRVTIEADGLLIRRGDSELFTGITNSAERGSSGGGGIVQIAAGELEILEGGEIRSSTFGSGDAGKVTIEADRVGILAGGSIGSATFSEGDAGRVTIEADGLLIRRGDSKLFTGVANSTERGSSGEGGIVQITAGELEILEGGQIRSGTFSSGDAGRVTVEADHLLIRRGASEFFTGVTAGAEPGSSGKAGIVQIAASKLEILEGGAIGSTTFSEGDAGGITVKADHLLIRGGGSEFFTGVFSSAAASVAGDVGQGDAGRVRIQAQTVEIMDAGGVSSSADGPGTAGDVMVRAADRLILDEASIDTATSAGGGGEIQLLVGDVIDLRDSEVTTSVAGGADPTAGNISIEPKILVIDGSLIQANAPAGFGGRVTIVADNILVPGGDFEALLARGEISATGGDPTRAGTIAVNAPEVDLSAGLVVVEGAFIDTAPLRERCGARRDIGASSLTGVGRGGLPPSPDGPLASAYVVDEAAVAEAQKAGSRRTAGTAPTNVRLVGLSAPPCVPLD